ncbi:MAG: hypothetical protein V8R52_11230 [Coprobacter fastidiosus]
MTTRFNVYFNGIENFKEQFKVMETSMKITILGYVSICIRSSAYGNPKETKPDGSFDRTIEKCQKAIKLHSIKKRPLRNQ